MSLSCQRSGAVPKLPRLFPLLVAPLALLISDPHAAAKAPPGSARIETGDPLPRAAASDRRCKDRLAGATRWLDSNPHVPFFISARERIEAAASACCAAWAVLGSRWRAIGAYGEVVGSAEVTGGEGYDVTQCYELKLRTVKGSAGIGIFASDGGGWHSPKRSARWQPTRQESEALARMVAGITALLDKPSWLDTTEPWPTRWDDRILPFQVQADPERGERGGRFAAVGGRVLIIARLDGRDWKLSFLDSSVALAGGDGVRPLAAFDIDGDAIPELIYHWDAGDSWADAVLRLDYQGWVEVAESVGGSAA